MAVPLEVLQSLASTFTTVLDGASDVQPGRPVTLRLAPSTAEGLRVTDIVPARVNLTWITKSVRFVTHTTEPSLGADEFAPASIDALLAGGMPARAPLVGNLAGTESLSGTPGELAQLAGEFPIPVEVPVRLTVTWEVLDESGTPVTSGFTALSGAGAPELTLAFDIQTVEFTTDMGTPIVRRQVRASVELAAGTTYTFTLPAVQLRIPAIPIPTVVACFLHGNFAGAQGDDDGAALVVVPNNSPLSNLAQLQDQLSTLRSTVNGLLHIANFAAFLTGLDMLSGALSAQANVEFRVTNAANDYDDMNDVTLLEKPWGWLFGWTNIEAEDELSSLVVVGPEGKRVQFFDHRDQGMNGAGFEVTVGPKLHVMVRSLHSAVPASGPDGGEISILTATPGTFGDVLSSLRFP